MGGEQKDEQLQSPALQRLRDFVGAHRQAWQQGPPDFEQFERELHEDLMRIERELIAEEVAC